MRRFCLWTLVATVCLVISQPAPAAAYYDEVHYVLTYYIARRLGYTQMQATRAAAAASMTDYSVDTEPVQALNPLRIDDSRRMSTSNINQGPRWRFHAFVDERRRGHGLTSDFPGDTVSPEGFWFQKNRDAFIEAQRPAIARQAYRLFRDGVTHKNPGIWIHYQQDRVPHDRYGTRWGHWDLLITPRDLSWGLPQGGSTDWMSFRGEIRPPGSKDPGIIVLDSARALYKDSSWKLAYYLKQASQGRQQPLPLEDDDDVLRTLIEHNRPAPPPLRSQGIKDVLGFMEFDHHRGGPDATQAIMAASDNLRRHVIQEEIIPPPPHHGTEYNYVIRAERNKLLPRWRDQEADFYEVDPTKKWESGKSGAESDRWVLFGDLKVELEYPDDFEASDKFELVVWSKPTLHAENQQYPNDDPDKVGAYELKDKYDKWPTMRRKNDQPPAIVNLPVGEVQIQLRRADGRETQLQTVKLDAKSNTAKHIVDFGDDKWRFFFVGDSAKIDPRFDLQKEENEALGVLVAVMKNDDNARPTASMEVRLDATIWGEMTPARAVTFTQKLATDLAPRNTDGYFTYQRRDVGQYEVLFIGTFVGNPEETTPWPPQLVAISVNPRTGSVFAKMTAAKGASVDELIGDWEGIKARSHALLDICDQGRDVPQEP